MKLRRQFLINAPLGLLAPFQLRAVQHLLNKIRRFQVRRRLLGATVAVGPEVTATTFAEAES